LLRHCNRGKALGERRSYEDANLEVLSLETGQWKVVHRGGYFGRLLPSGHLIYIHQGTLFAVSFDLDRLETRGTPVHLLDDVAANPGTGGGEFDFSRNGTFLYLGGQPRNPTPIVWLDSSGKTQPLPRPASIRLSAFRRMEDAWRC
jgi:hypothetical protein